MLPVGNSYGSSSGQNADRNVDNEGCADEVSNES